MLRSPSNYSISRVATVTVIVLLSLLCFGNSRPAAGQDVFSAGDARPSTGPVGRGSWIKLGPQHQHGSNGPYIWVPSCDEPRDHWLYGVAVYGDPLLLSNGTAHRLYSTNPQSAAITTASPSSIRDPGQQRQFQLYARQQQMVIGHPCRQTGSIPPVAPYGWDPYQPRPPSTSYPRPETNIDPVCKPGGQSRGINRAPPVLTVRVPPQLSIFVPGVQNAADAVNFLSTYHPLETAYVGIAVAGGRLAFLPAAHVSVQQVIGGELYTGEAAAINECDSAISRNAPPVKVLDRPISSSPTQNAQLQADIQALENEGAYDIRVNQQQVNEAGQRVGINRPDLQFSYKGVRYYVEYDKSSSTRGWPHGARIMANDQKGIVILKTVN